MQKPTLYEPILDKSVILQGDIFPEFDFSIPFSSTTHFTSGSPSQSPGSGISSLPNIDASTSLSASSQSPAFQTERRLMAVMTQSCDISDGDSLLISPIYTIDEYKLLEPKNFQSNLGHIRSRKNLLDKFYLENLVLPDHAVCECFINLKIVNMISRSSLDSSNKIASLSHWGRHLLNHQLMWLFGRPIIDWKS